MDRLERLEHEADDDFALFVAGLDKERGNRIVTDHAEKLQQRAMVALIAGYSDEALWFAERAYEFTDRAFGFRHEQARNSRRALQAIRQYAATCDNSRA